MNVEQAANFLAGTILICGGFAIIGITVVFLNNIFAKYWKTFTLVLFPETHKRFATEEEINRIPPEWGDTNKLKK